MPQTLHNACLRLMDDLTVSWDTTLHSTTAGHTVVLDADIGEGTVSCISMDRGISALVFDLGIREDISFGLGVDASGPIAHYLFVQKGKINHRKSTDEVVGAVSNRQCVVFRSDRTSHWDVTLDSKVRLGMVLISVDIEQNGVIDYFGSEKGSLSERDNFALTFDYNPDAALLLKKIFSIKQGTKSTMLAYKAALFGLLSLQIKDWNVTDQSKRTSRRTRNKRDKRLPPINA